MLMKDVKKYFHPGCYIQDAFMALTNMSLKEVSKKSGINEGDLKAVMAGLQDITPEMANKLPCVFGASPKTWMNLQISYNEYKKKLQGCEDYKN